MYSLEVRLPTADEILHAMGIIIYRETKLRGGKIHIPPRQLQALLFDNITVVGLGTELCFTALTLQGAPNSPMSDQERRMHQVMSWLLRKAPRHRLVVAQRELMEFRAFTLEGTTEGLFVGIEIPKKIGEGQILALQPQGQVKF